MHTTTTGVLERRARVGTGCVSGAERGYGMTRTRSSRALHVHGRCILCHGHASTAVYTTLTYRVKWRQFTNLYIYRSRLSPHDVVECNHALSCSAFCTHFIAAS